jgi:hypothetical protein
MNNMKKLIIMCLVLFVSNAKAQVINWVDNTYNADITVYFTSYKYEADVIVYKTTLKYEAKQKPGYWWWDENLSSNYEYKQLNIKTVKYKYQADLIVYVTTYKHEIKLSRKYLDLIK